MSNDEKRERPATAREIRMLDQIGSRDAARAVFRAQNAEKRARSAVWGFKTGANTNARTR